MNPMQSVKIPRGQTPNRRAYMKAYCESHPKRDRRAYKARYDSNHESEAKAYRIANKERLKAQKRAYYLANRERLLRYAMDFSKANPERVSAYHADHYAMNSDRIKSNVKAWSKANPEKQRHYGNKRRLLKIGNGGSHTIEELQHKFSMLGNVCFYCGVSGPLSIDHDLPISRGGSDDIENILPACKSCNSKKSAMTSLEFLAKIGITNHTQIGGTGNKPNEEYKGR